MAGRPARERKAPKRLEDEQEDTSSTIANVGRNPRPAKSRKTTPDNKQEDTTADVDSAVGRGRGRGRGSRGGGYGRGHGRAQGRGGSKASVRPSRRQRLGSSGDDGDTTLEPSTSLINDGAVDGGSDQDYGSDENFDSVPLTNRSTTAARRDLNQKRLLIPYVPIEDDATIEQWYADPYQRIDPAHHAYDEWRRNNLQESLMSRGINIVRARPVANWLMKCNGHFIPTDGSKQRAPGRRSRKKSETHQDSAERLSQTMGQDTEPNEDGDTMDLDMIADFKEEGNFNDHDDSINEEDEEGTVRDSQSQIHGLTRSDTAGKERLESSPLCNAGHSRATSTISDLTRTAIKNAAQSLSPEPSQLYGWSQLRGGNAKSHAYSERDIDRQIESLKGSLKRFQLVYGDNLPESDYSKYDIDHISSTAKLPRAVPKAGFRTQGHKHLQYAVIPNSSTALTNHMLESQTHNRVGGQANDGLQHNQTRPHDPQVLTEDPHFGLFPFDRSEVHTFEEKEMLRVQNARVELRDTNIKDQEAVRKLHTEIAEEKELEKQLVLQQLKRKVFSWETDSMIAGVLTDENGLPNGNFYRVREDNEKWQRLAERQATLKAGGEAAEKIYLEEWEAALEEERKEKRREDRRRQSAKQKAKAAGVAVEETRLCGWVAEE